MRAITYFIVTGICTAVFVSCSGGPTAVPTASSQKNTDMAAKIGEEADQNATVRIESPQELSEVAKVQQQIAAYEQQIQAEPQSEDTPARLLAVANLYMTRLRDYDKAATTYEYLIQQYPTWEHIGQVYIQLSTCYTNAGKQAEANRLAMRMLEIFPPDSQEYLYAQSLLKAP